MTIRNSSAAPRFLGWRADLHALAPSCIRFGRLLRSRGVPVAPDQVARWLRSLHLLGCTQPGDLFWSGRVNLVSRREHLPVYDDLFRRFWLTLDHGALRPEDAPRSREDPPARAPAAAPPAGLGGSAAGPAPPGDRSGPRGDAARWLQGWRAPRPATPAATHPGGPEESGAGPLAPGLYSPGERLHRPRGDSLPAPLDRGALQALLGAASLWQQPGLRSRRWAPARPGARVDLRRTLAAAARTGGLPVQLVRCRRRRRWRRWVFLCDISASMGPQVRDWLAVLQVVVSRRRNTEVFLFGTRLTRVTPLLRRAAPGRLDTLVPAVPDWQGGTRLGQALQSFYRGYARRGAAHGAVLVILSDGLDQGEGEQVGAAMAALGRLARRVIWVNPLKRSPRYQPLALAMAAALPHVDELWGAHDLASLAAVISRLAGLD